MGMRWPLGSEPPPPSPLFLLPHLRIHSRQWERASALQPHLLTAVPASEAGVSRVGWEREWPGSWASRHLHRACCTGTNTALLEGHWEHREGTDKWASKVKGKLNRRQKNTPRGGIANRKVPRPKRAGCVDTREKWVSVKGRQSQEYSGNCGGGSGPQA